MLFFHNGDVFNCPLSHSMAHCISGDAKMSKGIAVQFVEKFPVLAKLRKVTNPVGTAVPVSVGTRVIHCLVSKKRFWMKPTTSTLYKCLYSMFCHARLNAVTDISVPKLASGCDKMSFEWVNQILGKIFSDHVINLHVYFYGSVPRYVVLQFKADAGL